jgi:peptide/nickel transport system permease protein
MIGAGRDRPPALGLAIGLLAILLLAALVAPFVERALGLDANAVDLAARLLPPSAHHPLGTDELGRDLLLRLLYGGRVSLAVGLAAALASTTLGTSIGLCAGFFGGQVDAALMRLTDAVIALPLLPLLIVLAAIDVSKIGLPASFVENEHSSLYRIIAIVALAGWTTVARLVRGASLALRARDFVLAAEALGAGSLRIMGTHLLPNLLGPVTVATALAAGQVILFESVLSFLGLGIQPPTPSWGNMLTGAQEVLWTAPWLAVFPGLLIFATVAGCNRLADSLSAILDPRRGAKI